MGGQISHESTPEIIEYVLANNIEIVFFSTFFDPDLVRQLSSRGIQTVYISYPLRDSFSNLFFLRKNSDLFDHIVILGDLYTNAYPDFVQRTLPLFINEPSSEQNTENMILVTCGGGGRPSSQVFIEKLREYVRLMKEKTDVQFIVIKGPNNNAPDIPGTEVIEYTDSLVEYIDRSKCVISEAGYYTTHELISRHKPSILIPGARRVDNQELRAIAYEENNLGFCCMPEEDMTFLVKRTLQVLQDSSLYTSFVKNNKEYYEKTKKSRASIQEYVRGLVQ
jgi:UDP-N-acetylglucosamine:LPS N-acetylglucosamine transferase